MNEPFYWGVASSALQTEGAAFKEGKGPSIWDIFSEKKGNIHGRHTPENACSFYYRYEEDLDLIQSMNIPNFRFSVSWPRILPQGRKHINPKGISFYDRLIDSCLERNIEPWLTIYHWDLPLQLEMQGGWTNRDILGWFSDYTELLLTKYADRVKHWMVLNEPLVFTGAGYFLGVHAPGKKGMNNFLSAAHHAALVQAAGIRQIKSFDEQLKVGTTFSCSDISSYSNEPKDIEAAIRVNALLNRFFVEPLLGYGYPIKDLPFVQRIEQFYKANDEQLLQASPDFIGLQNYTREVVKYAWTTPYLHAKLISAKKRNAKHTLLQWEIYPEGIYNLIHQFAAYPEVKEIIVTENGAAFVDIKSEQEVLDTERIEFLKSYISQVRRAKKDCSKLKGYFVWSLTDNFEWAEGYSPRFGLVHIDYDNQQRTIKASGKWYKRLMLYEAEKIDAVVY